MADCCLTFQRTNSVIFTSRHVLTEILFPLTTLSCCMVVIGVRECTQILLTTNTQNRFNVVLLQGILQCFDHVCGHLQWDLNKNTIRITGTIIWSFAILLWLLYYCNCFCILVYTSLKMAKLVAETSCRIPCNKITSKYCGAYGCINIVFIWLMQGIWTIFSVRVK